VHNDPSKSSKVIDFGTNRKPVYDFLFDFNSNLVLSCRVSEILELLYAESHFFSTPPLFGRKFQCVPFGLDPWRLGCKERTSQANCRWNYFRRIPTYAITIQSTNVTDRQTDDMRSQYRALH